MAAGHSIDVDLVRALYSYDPDTGHLTSKKTGRVVGWRCERGYIKIRVKRVWKKAHRVAWAIYYGESPPPMIDHINGDRADNRIANLRESNACLNQQNMLRARRTSRTGLLGANPMRNGLFKAVIKVGGVAHDLGVYGSPESAHAAYMAAKAKLHPHAWIVNGQQQPGSVAVTPPRAPASPVAVPPA